jgi:tRNA-2-methylthio-N6-dimethylallyladenosine synthase
MVGREVEVLVEGLGKVFSNRDPNALPQLTGRSMADHIVVFDAPERLTGSVVKARVVDATSFTLFAEVLEVVSSPPGYQPGIAIQIPAASKRLELPISQ